MMEYKKCESQNKYWHLSSFPNLAHILDKEMQWYNLATRL